MRLAPAIGFSLLAAFVQFALRALFDHYTFTGSGDANAAYATAALVTLVLLFGTIAVAIAHLAFLDGARAQTLPAYIGLGVLGLFASAMGPITFYITVVIFAAVTLYVPNLIAAGRGLADGIAESCGLALAGPAPAFAALAIMTGGFALAGILGGIFAGFSPLAADLIAGAVTQFTVALVAPRLAIAILKPPTPSKVS